MGRGAEEHSANGGAGIVGALEAGGAKADRVLHNGGQQVVLASDVSVDEAEIHLGGVGDLAERYPRTAFGKQSPGLAQDGRADLVAAGGTACGSGRGCLFGNQTLAFHSQTVHT